MVLHFLGGYSYQSLHRNHPPKLVLNQGARLSGGVWTLPSLETERVGEGFPSKKKRNCRKTYWTCFFLEGKGSWILGKILAVIWMNLIRFMGLRKNRFHKHPKNITRLRFLRFSLFSHVRNDKLTSWQSKWSGMAARKNGSPQKSSTYTPLPKTNERPLKKRQFQKESRFPTAFQPLFFRGRVSFWGE